MLCTRYRACKQCAVQTRSRACLAEVVGLDVLLDGKVKQLSTGHMLQVAAGPVVLCHPAVLPYLIDRGPATTAMLP